MIAKILILLVSTSLFSGLVFADANSDAFNDGKTFGATQNSTIKPTITPANGSANVPGYSGTSGESILYNNGNGVLTPSANADVGNCNSTTSASDPNIAAHGHCESVRMLTANPNKKAAVFPLDKANDPLVVQGKAIKSNPTLYTGSGFGGGAYSACVNKTVNTGAVYQDEHCSEYLTVEGRQCSETLNVTVTKNDSCVPGTWFATINTGRDGTGPSHPDQIYAQARCDMTTPGQKQTFQIYAHGGQGACVGWQQLQIDPLVANTTPIAAPSLSPHWNGYCQALTTSYIHNGCPGNNCSTAFTFATSTSTCPGGSGGIGGGCAAYCPGQIGGFGFGGSGPSCGIGGCSCPGGGSPSTAPVITKTTRGILTLNYQKPHSIVTVTDAWDDQCATYKARLP